MFGSKWRRPGFISLRDEIERRGREQHGSEWPQPPTEEDVGAEGERWREKAHRDFRPSIGPALPGGGARESGSADDVIGKSKDDFIGPDPRTIDGDPIAHLTAYNVEQTLRRINITKTLNDKYERARSKLMPEIIDGLRSELYEGKVFAIYEKRLVDVPIDRMFWRLPEAEAALSSGKYAGFEIVLKVRLDIGANGNSTAAAETRATKCLVDLMTKDPIPPPGTTGDKLYPEFKDRFGLSRRAFDRAKARAIEKTGAEAWKKPGRR